MSLQRGLELWYGQGPFCDPILSVKQTPRAMVGHYRGLLKSVVPNFLPLDQLSHVRTTPHLQNVILLQMNSS